MHDDLAYCFQCDNLTLTDLQQFVLRGKAWKKGGPKPLGKLLVNELRQELQGHGIDTDGKLRDELDDIFDEMRSGINSLPALLKPNPENMPSYLSLYEISPVEPLHDLKGHISNIVAELQKTLTGETKVHVDDIIKVALSKETLRASDYRKVIILLLEELRKIKANSKLANTAIRDAGGNFGNFVRCSRQKDTCKYLASSQHHIRSWHAMCQNVQ